MLEQNKKKNNPFQSPLRAVSNFFEYKQSCSTHGYPVHQHNYLETEIILEGEGVHICNDIAYPIQRGDVYIIRTTDRHAYKHTSSTEVINISFGEKLLSADTLLQFNTFCGNIFSHMEEKDFQIFLKLCNLAKKEFQSKNKNEKIIKNLVNCICIYVLRYCNDESKLKSNSVFSATLAYLHNHFRDGITLTKLAAELGYSPHHISRIFKKEIGTNFNQYFNNLRLKYAEHLLFTTNLSITDIGIRSGFSSYNHFQNNFLKSFGITPSEYKKALSTNISHSDYNIRVVPYHSFVIDNSNIYAMILISPLKANTLYAFSYSSSNDTNLILECIHSPNGEIIDVVLQNQKNKFEFKTSQAGEYMVQLLKKDSATDENTRLTVPDSVTIKEIDLEM